jgi:hypothetical protein
VVVDVTVVVDVVLARESSWNDEFGILEEGGRGKCDERRDRREEAGRIIYKGCGDGREFAFCYEVKWGLLVGERG